METNDIKGFGFYMPENTLDKNGNIRKCCENCKNALVIDMNGERWKYTCERGTFSAKHRACEDFIPHGYIKVQFDDGTSEVVPWMDALKYVI